MLNKWEEYFAKLEYFILYINIANPMKFSQNQMNIFRYVLLIFVKLQAHDKREERLEEKVAKLRDHELKVKVARQTNEKQLNQDKTKTEAELKNKLEKAAKVFFFQVNTTLG